MARVSTYLNFSGDAEEAFRFYSVVFRTDPVGAVTRLGDVAPGPDVPELSESDKAKIMHIELPILGNHVIMGTDLIESMGHQLKIGNNTTLNLEPDTLEETQRLFDALSERASDMVPLAEMFWGAVWGTCLDRFGIRWMFNYYTPAANPS